MTTSGLISAGRNGTVVPIVSVLAAAAILIVASVFIWLIVRQQRRGTLDVRLGARIAEIAVIETDQSSEATAGTFGGNAAWDRDRKRIMKIEADLAELATASTDDRAVRVLHALSKWRASIDVAYDDAGDERDRVAAASVALRAELDRPS
jgi:hypothetical protein